MPGPIAGYGTDIDTDALYRRIALLESRSQDPANVAITGGTIGGLAVSALPQRLANMPLTFVAFGDSLTAGSEDATGHKQQFPFMVEAYSKGSLRMLKNAGVPGNTSADMLARVANDVIRYKPKLCFLLGFTNDTANSFSNATTLANLSSIYALLQAAGIQLVFIAAPPLSTSTPVRQAQELKNAALREWCDANYVAHIAPWGFATDTATGAWASGFSGDSTHPQPRYYGNVARAIVAATVLPPVSPRLALSNVQADNSVTNGLFLNGTGVPTGWNDTSGTTNVVLTQQAASFAQGNSVKFDGSAASTGTRVLNQNAAVVGGRTYEFSCVVQASGVEAGGGKWGIILNNVSAGFSPFGTSYRPAFDLLYDGTMYIRGQWVADPAAAYLGINLYNGAAVGATGIVEFAQVTVRDLTVNGFAATEYPWV